MTTNEMLTPHYFSANKIITCLLLYKKATLIHYFKYKDYIKQTKTIRMIF